jgi:glycosyltransferase involved in cell wall biosynthesis
LYSASFTTPQGDLAKRGDDPPGFQPEPIVLAERVDKSNLAARRKADVAHGRKVAARIATFHPEVVLSGNTPLDAQKLILEHTQSHGGKFIFWVQDLIGQAAMRLLGKKWGGLGRIVGAHYVSLENKLLARSDKIVVIAEDFRPHLPASVRNTPRVEVVENWAVLAEIPERPRFNDWGIQHGFAEGLTFLYSGTLGLKHNPGLLVSLAESLAGVGRVVVVSEGASVEFLKRQMAEKGLENLHVLPFQPFASMAEMLATADVLVAILEPDAGVFSVPSKVLTYLCAGRPLLLAVPPENLAARIVSSQGAGLVVPPNDEAGFLAAAKELASDEGLRSRLGRAARDYAERTFAIEAITDKFERILKV